jgi:hypothetical protein
MRRLKERTKGLVSRSRTGSPSISTSNREDPGYESNHNVKPDIMALEAASSALQPGIVVDSEKVNTYRETEEAKHEAPDRHSITLSGIPQWRRSGAGSSKAQIRFGRTTMERRPSTLPRGGGEIRSYGI